MTDQTPYARLTGTWKFWLAAAQTAIPDLDAAPSGSWTDLGVTEGDQNLQWQGALVPFRDNDSTGKKKHVRPEEGFDVSAIFVHLTLETLARVLGMPSSAVVGGTSGALTTKKLAFRRGYVPTRYALLARGGAVVATNTLSPYGAWPAQLWVPQIVLDGEPQATFGKAGSPGVQARFVAEYDTTQSAGEEFGYLIAQSA